jgi:hypothetical protein
MFRNGSLMNFHLQLVPYLQRGPHAQAPSVAAGAVHTGIPLYYFLRKVTPVHLPTTFHLSKQMSSGKTGAERLAPATTEMAAGNSC